jgi:hypothetical protein
MPSGNGQPGDIQGPFTDSTGTYYTVGGQKSYVSPVALGTGSAPSGGMFTNSGTFNNDTGQWDQGPDWSNILSMVAAGMLTAGAATALMGGGPEAEAAVANASAGGGSTGGGAAAGGAAAGGAVTGGASGGGVSTGGILSALKGASTGSSLLKSLTGGTGTGGYGPSPLSSLSTTAGSVAQQIANGEIAQAKLQQGQDQNQLAREKLALQAPGMEASNSVRGDILANAQDANITPPAGVTMPTITGGLRPSMFSSNTRQLGGVMSRNALANELAGTDVAPLTPLPSPPTGAGALQGVALGAGFLNALSPLMGGNGSSSTPNLNAPNYGNNAPWQGPIDQPITNTDDFDPTLDWTA